MPSDFIWTIIAFFLTIMVLSYVLGDNELFRLIIMIFVGVTAGYTAVLIIYQIILPRLIVPLINAPIQQKGILIVPAILAILLLFKLSNKLANLGNVSMGFLTGVGAAIAIGGAVTGTLFGQINGAVRPFDVSGLSSAGSIGSQLLGGIVLLVGSIGSLAYFHFGARNSTNEKTQNQPFIVQLLAKIGQVFIAITLGAIFAGVLAASISALIERLDFIINVIKPFFA